MALLGSHLVLMTTLLFPATLAATYSISVYSDHVYPFMPFVSYTGDLPIESCIFSAGINITAALFLFVVFIRYNQVLKVVEGDDSADAEATRRTNSVGLKWGTVTALGLSVTASFQQFHAEFVHLLGAATCSYGGFAYFCYQTVLSRRLVGVVTGKRVFYFRAALCLWDAAFLLSVPLLLLYLDLIYDRTHAETICWNHREEGWPVHLCSSLVEWLLFVSNEAYVISFYREFKSIRIEPDEIHFDPPNLG